MMVQNGLQRFLKGIPFTPLVQLKEVAIDRNFDIKG